MKVILFVCSGLLSLTLGSCMKNYTCQCTSTVGTASYLEDNTFIHKKDAQAWCEGSNGAEGSNVTCTLQDTKTKKKKKDSSAS